MPGLILIARFRARASLNTAFHFHGMSAVVMQASGPLPHSGETVHPPLSLSQEEMNLGGLLRQWMGSPGFGAMYVLPVR